MSDIFWIILIAIAYFYIIRPMFQGAVGGKNNQQPKTNQQQPPASTRKKSKPGDSDYVDYEEIK